MSQGPEIVIGSTIDIGKPFLVRKSPEVQNARFRDLPIVQDENQRRDMKRAEAEVTRSQER